MSPKMLGIWLAVITAINVLTGLRWSLLKHNPWSGRSFGGAFSPLSPGLTPAKLTVADINRWGRWYMILSPIPAALLFAIYLHNH